LGGCGILLKTKRERKRKKEKSHDDRKNHTKYGLSRLLHWWRIGIMSSGRESGGSCQKEKHNESSKEKQITPIRLTSEDWPKSRQHRFPCGSSEPGWLDVRQRGFRLHFFLFLLFFFDLSAQTKQERKKRKEKEKEKSSPSDEHDWVS